MGFDSNSDERTRVVSLPAPGDGDPFDGGDDPPDAVGIGFAVGGAVHGPWKLTLVLAIVVLVVLLWLDGDVLGQLFSR